MLGNLDYRLGGRDRTDVLPGAGTPEPENLTARRPAWSAWPLHRIVNMLGWVTRVTLARNCGERRQ